MSLSYVDSFNLTFFAFNIEGTAAPSDPVISVFLIKSFLFIAFMFELIQISGQEGLEEMCETDL